MRTIYFLAFYMLVTSSITAQTDHIYAKINGMGCAYCANGIERAFKDLKQKKSFKIDLQEGTMDFDYPASEAIGHEAILQRVDKAGYTVTEINIKRSDGTIFEWKTESKPSKDKEKQNTEAIFTVLGNCGMCKTRIENAVNELDGIFFAFWDSKTQKLHVRFDANKISQEDIELEVASIGHDTEKFKASDEVYENLHGCCKYDRNPKQ